MRELDIRFSLSHINLSKLVNIFTSTLFFNFLNIVLFGLLSSPLVVLLSTLVIKLQSDHYIILLLFCGTDCNRIYVVAHHVTLSRIFNSIVSDFSTSLFLEKLKTHLCHCSFPP